jgi:hypothetical protein
VVRYVGDDDICAGALVAPDRLVTTTSCAGGAEWQILRVGGVRRRVAGTTFPRAATASIVRGARVDCNNYSGMPVRRTWRSCTLAQRVFVPPLPLAEAVVHEAATVVGHGTTDTT